MKDYDEYAGTECFPSHVSMTNGNPNHRFLLKSGRGGTEVDVEKLWRTMIAQDAVFRSQVFELHRVYRIQRELMNGVKMKDSKIYAAPSSTSQLISFSGKMPYDDINGDMPMTNFSMVSRSNGKAIFSGIGGNQSHINFPSDNGDSFCKDGILLKGCEVVDSRSTQYPKIMIDLQLPADAYIDCENAETNEKNGLKFTLDVSNDPVPRTSRTRPILADLNEPVDDDVFLNGAAGPQESLPIHAGYEIDEIHRHQLPASSFINFLGMQSDSIEQTPREEGTCSYVRHANQEKYDKQLLLNYGADQIRNYSSSIRHDLKDSCLPGEMKVAKDCEMLLDQMKIEAPYWQKPEPHNSIQFSDPRSGNSFVGSPLVSDSGKTFNSENYRVNPVQTLQFSNTPPALSMQPMQGMHSGSTIRSVSNRCKWRTDSPTLYPACGGGSSLYVNGTQRYIRPYSGDSNMNLCSSSLNLEKPNDTNHCDNSPYGEAEAHVCRKFYDGFPSTERAVNTNPDQMQGQHAIDHACGLKEKNCGKSSDDISWLVPKLHRNGFTDSENYDRCYSQISANNDLMGRGIEPQVENPSAALVFGQERENDRMGTQKLVGFHFSLFGKPTSQNRTAYLNDLAGKHSQNTRMGGKSPIDLNSAISPEDIMEFQLSPSVPSVTTNNSTKVDFEASTGSHSEDLRSIQLKPFDLNQLDKQNQAPFVQATVSRLGFSFDETVVRVAAENIMALSHDWHGIFRKGISRPYPPSCDSLSWFAGVVLSTLDVEGELREAGDGCFGYSDGASSNSFETRALKLEEVTANNVSSCRPEEQEEENDDELGISSSLLFCGNKPRRRQVRRRRRWRDFQKDILPGIAVLSRNEVTEDLQTIASLMTDASGDWKSSFGRKLGGNSGRASRSRQRKRNAGAAVTIEVSDTDPDPATTHRSEINESNIIGWGRTRRCRRPAKGHGDVPWSLLA